ncbi:MAG: spore coat protein CotJB [Erysipelotrichales bacterium]|nr:spore coat protein CotJB [Erysipelotrichales bacterium]
MYKKQDALLKLQMLSFAVIEISLYLDAYPDCQEALGYRNQLLEMYEKERAMYVKEYGPLSICDEGDYERYVNEPWPWEVCR